MKQKYIDLYNEYLQTAETARETARKAKAERKAAENVFCNFLDGETNIQAFKRDPETYKAETARKAAAIDKAETARKAAEFTIAAAEELAAKTIKAGIVADMKERPEAWTKYPTHYKKFKAFVKEATNSTATVYMTGYRLEAYVTGVSYHNAEHTIIYRGTDAAGKITLEEIEKATADIPEVKPNDLFEVAKAAIEDHKKVMKIYEEAAKHADEIREQYKDINFLYWKMPAIGTINNRYI